MNGATPTRYWFWWVAECGYLHLIDSAVDTMVVAPCPYREEDGS